VREDRRVVTALFADLTGSTGLTRRLREDEAKIVVGDAIARIVVEVERLGGYVKDLAGDGVLALFGAPTSYEDDAERAVRTASNIVQSMAAFGAEVSSTWTGETLAVRVGVSTGLVATGMVGAGQRVEYAAFGDTVITAARLQSLAEPGSALVDEATRQRVERLFEWGERQTLALKGRTDTTAAYRLGAARPTSTHRRPSGHAAATIVGRDLELAALRAALDEVRSGAGGIVLVTGDAGVGKSRLVATLRDVAEHDPDVGVDPLWLEGRCLSYAEQLPNYPFRDLLRNWLGVYEGDPKLRVRVNLRSALERLFEDPDDVRQNLESFLGLGEDDGGGDHDLDAEERQRRMFAAVASVFERLARDRPLVVVLEDLHWADSSSLQLLGSLLPCTERAAVLFVLTHRDERDREVWTVKETVVRDFPHVARDLALAPLPPDAERSLLDTLVGAGTLPDEVARRLLDAAEGNPLYLEELVGSLWDSGALLRTDDGSWRLDSHVPITIPETIGKVILARVDRLPTDEHAVLVAASVIGRRFDRWLLEALLGGRDAADLLHELQRLGFVTMDRRWPHERYRFRHALIQEAVYATLLASQRMDLHRLAAQSLEQSTAQTQEEMLALAHHWDAAGEPTAAIPYYRQGAELALHVYANEEAAEALSTALDLLASTPAGEKRDHTELTLRTLRGIAGWGTEGLGAAVVVSDFARAKELSTIVGQPVSPPVLRGLAINSIVRLDLADARDNGDALLAAAQRTGDPVLLVEAEYVLGVTTFWIGELEASHHHLQTALASYSPDRRDAHIAQFSQDPQVVCLIRLAWTMWHLGHVAAATRACDDALALATEVGHPASLIYAAVFAGFLTSDMADEGRFGTALEAVAGFRLRGAWADAVEVLRLRREALAGVDGAAATIEKLVDTADGKHSRVYNNQARFLAAQGYLVVDDPAAALRVLTKGMAEATSSGAVYSVPELYRLSAVASAADGASTPEVDALFRAAEETARDSHALSPLLLAATSWSDWAASTADDAMVAAAERARSQAVQWCAAASAADVS
jgi:class 3 adenylate cyclase